jgi:hypothetical protein
MSYLESLDRQPLEHSIMITDYMETRVESIPDRSCIYVYLSAAYLTMLSLSQTI